MIRILFVDDETSVLNAMRRTLHHMRDEWQMEFADSGEAALKALAAAPADVLISDMRMPGMDGWQLLREVKQRYPQTVRLILSGHSDARSIMRTVGTAQQYLAKPCDSTSLKAVISGAYVLRQVLNSDRLAHLVGRVGMLPSAPKAFQEILTCLQNPGASIADAAKIIGRDVSMTANVLKLVNSAFFGARQTMATAERAVAYLGLDTLGALVLAHSTFKGSLVSVIRGFSLDALWQHSLEVATTARTLALYEKLPQSRADEAFLCGMLHDVGKVVFATRAVPMPDGTPASDEQALAQMDTHHAEVGAYLLGLWGFPNSIIEAVAFHHAPSQAGGEGFTLPKLIHIADRMVHQRRVDRPPALDGGLEPKLLENLGMEMRWADWSGQLDLLENDRTCTKVSISPHTIV
jgi:putative nucleotidyltransferase with HDIG domain